MPDTAIFRVDASANLGAGHVMRCLTLADTLAQAGWKCGFASRNGTQKAAPRVARSGHAFAELGQDAGADPAALTAAFPDGCDLLVVDHYGLAAEYERACRPWARRIFVIDDLADRHHDCELLLDSSPSRGAEDYQRLVPPDCQLLLGPDYALLRQAFRKARVSALARRSAGPVKRILVTLGAGDPGELATLALEGVHQAVLDVSVDFVLGPGIQQSKDLSEAVARMPFPVTMHENPEDLVALMVAADLALGASGQTALERCCLGLPSVLIITAPNQAHLAKAISDSGAARLIDSSGRAAAPAIGDALCKLSADGYMRTEISHAAAALCDGEGAGRTAARINAYCREHLEIAAGNHK